jgi:GTP cyclohydrolase I
MKTISWDEFVDAVFSIMNNHVIKTNIERGGIDSVFGIPRDGNFVAVAMSMKDPRLKLTDSPSHKTLIVDDFIRTGVTMSHYTDYEYKIALVTCGVRKHDVGSIMKSPIHLDHVPVFPWKVEKNGIGIFRDFVEFFVGNNLLFDGKIEYTPHRMNRLYESFSNRNLSELIEDSDIETTYETKGPDNLMCVRGILFKSLCECHIMPVYGTIDIVYSSKTGTISFSAISKIVEYVVGRVQNQNDISSSISKLLYESVLKPQGVAVKVSAIHTCSMYVNESMSGTTVTYGFRGKFSKDRRAEALKYLDGDKVS